MALDTTWQVAHLKKTAVTHARPAPGRGAPTGRTSDGGQEVQGPRSAVGPVGLCSDTVVVSAMCPPPHGPCPRCRDEKPLWATSWQQCSNSALADWVWQQLCDAPTWGRPTVERWVALERAEMNRQVVTRSLCSYGHLYYILDWKGAGPGGVGAERSVWVRAQGLGSLTGKDGPVSVHTYGSSEYFFCN